MLEDILITIIGAECLLLFFNENQMISSNFRYCISLLINLVFGTTLTLYVTTLGKERYNMTTLVVILVFAIVATFLVTIIEIESKEKDGEEVTKKTVLMLALGNTTLFVVVSPLIGLILKHTIM
jgi:hypothetical protein